MLFVCVWLRKAPIRLMRTFKKKGGIQTKKIKDNFQMGIENQWLERENVRERERENGVVSTFSRDQSS